MVSYNCPPDMSLPSYSVGLAHAYRVDISERYIGTIFPESFAGQGLLAPALRTTRDLTVRQVGAAARLSRHGAVAAGAQARRHAAGPGRRMSLSRRLSASNGEGWLL